MSSLRGRLSPSDSRMRSNESSRSPSTEPSPAPRRSEGSMASMTECWAIIPSSTLSLGGAASASACFRICDNAAM
ncbi:hypothetical protein CEXT_105471 [Caerostris extrusa]|uniref:Uncharacterized protein n=1 Tax=Caerostris extrusa TaxID=172846 RepID=A0AAV4Y954_CAEEX|nr:hypothetical protein CEXT_105471 [Caerostris extrusa]